MVAPLHLGSLHGYETVLLAVLAFGPFVVLAVVVTVMRRRESGTDEQS
jgi:Na+-translocating ferredoxin:NAD+ oxidoreductase RnfE subunit